MVLLFTMSIRKPTSHYDNINDAVCSQKNVIISGLPGSGKTTLLMQLAAHISDGRQKLVFSEMRREEADLIKRSLDGNRALIFVDNFCNDIHALQSLSDSSQIQVVAADREHWLSTIRHLIDHSKFSINDVTELTRKDITGCRNSIPDSIRTLEFADPEVARGLRPCLFEFVQANIREPNLRQRFLDALKDLRSKQPQLAEMLLLVAYVHACRTPISMDMTIAYWHDDIHDYREVYKLFSDAGGYITEYEGDLATEQQDYFAARSVLVAESILSAVDREEFKRMLLRVLRNVSIPRICNYEIFRRHAFDHSLIGRAFSTWEEGSDFYDEVVEKDLNPYVLQHKALFLSQRNRHGEAFKAIDAALGMTRVSNWSIENSHAIILFRANIDFFQDPAARRILDESMTLLRRCYNSDRRKVFHVLIYANHALRYYSKYRDDKAKEYLELARQWLVKQREENPWLRSVERLHDIVNRVLERG